MSRADHQAYPDGWYPDPWNRWPERYFQAGGYTDRVRSGAGEGSDPQPAPPAAPAPPAPRGYGFPPVGLTPPPAAAPAAPGPPAPGGVPLQPLNTGDTIDTAFRLFRANLRTIVPTIVAIAAPLDLVSALVQRANLGNQSIFTQINSSQTATTTTNNGSPVATGIAVLLSILLLPYAAGAVSRVVAGAYLGDVPSPGTALGATLRRFLPLLVAWLFVHVLEVFGTVLLIVPGLLVMALSVCVAPVIVLEGLGPVRAIRRSWSLNRPRMWKVLGTALLSGLVTTIVGGLIGTPLDVIGLAMGLGWGWILLYIGTILTSIVTLGMNAIIATLIYFDGRIRYEGFDLEVLARGIS